MIHVVRAGQGATVQDLGRPGLARWAIGRSGAADRGSFHLANRLVGNDPGAAAIEITFGDFAFTTDRALVLALTGAVTPVGTETARAGFAMPFVVRPGETVRLGRPRHGLRSYLAVRGGIDVPAVLGSRSADTLGGIGPPPVVTGADLPVGPAPIDPVPGLPTEVAPRRALDDDITVRVVPGPRDDWTELSALFTARFVVRTDSDRIGTRLAGPALARRAGELAPEATMRGAVQVPPDGLPIILGPDRPVTGGYPVVAVVVDADLDAVAQARPGSLVRFRPAGRLP